jgi:hypothetical protein
LSTISSQTITTTTLYNNVNDGTWKINAILGITANGTVLLVAYRDGSQLIIIVSDLASTGAAAILDGNLGVLKAYVRPGNAAALAADPAVEVKLLGLGSVAVGSTVPVAGPGGGNLTVNAAQSGAWTGVGIVGTRSESVLPIAGTHATVLAAKDAAGLLQFLPMVQGGGTFLNAIQVVFAASDITGNLNVAEQNAIRAAQPINGVLKTLTPAANHITTNTTITLTAADAWISSIVITVDAAGTTSTVTVQDKGATPKKLVNGLSTTGITNTPTVISLPQPVLMSGGIDIITAGAVAGTEDVWVDYWQ